MPDSAATILILDDDVDIACAAQLLLRRHFRNVLTLSDPASLPQLLRDRSPDVVLLDLNFTAGRIDGAEGLALLDTLQNQAKPPVVIAMTAYADVPLAVAAIKRGAIDFVTKPWDNAHLVAVIENALTQRVASDPSLNLNSDIPSLLGDSTAMRHLRALIARVGPTTANVMILGENGVGKELVARAIHDASARRDQIFLSVDMGALPEATFESELYGHRKGSFTGAQGERAGRFQTARGGTLFLDEIGNLPLAAQAKLLTALERREVTPLGADRATAIDVRIVSATNLEEAQLYQPDIFRPDLLFRLNTIVIRVPPLRSRSEDIPQLLRHYLSQFEQQYQRAARNVTADAILRLSAYTWPGNVRELRQACERAVILNVAAEYTFDDFGLSAIKAVASVADIVSHKIESVPLDIIERDAVNGALDQAKGNISQAAKALGISRAALYRKIEKHGL